MQPITHIQPVEAWEYHIKERERLETEMVEIASDEKTKTSIYATDEDGLLVLYVYRDDKKIFQSECYTKYTAERNLREIYSKYLTTLKVVNVQKDAGTPEDQYDDDDDIDVPPESDLDAMTESEFQEYVDEREDVILEAVCNMINILTEDISGELELEENEEDNLETVVNNIVEYLAIKCGLRVRRPMEVLDEDSGDTVRTEYPYEEYEFGDGELSANKS